VFIELLLVLAVDPYPHLPPLSDLARLPSPEACAEQVRRHDRHLERLDELAAAWPERRADFARWRAETEKNRFLWQVLKETEAASKREWRSAEQRREDLGRWRWWVGEGLYRQGWTPPEVPACLYPEMKKAAEEVGS
jgi:hypothetical protein